MRNLTDYIVENDAVNHQLDISVIDIAALIRVEADATSKEVAAESKLEVAKAELATLESRRDNPLASNREGVPVSADDPFGIPDFRDTKTPSLSLIARTP
jgi:hypothetical protein